MKKEDKERVVAELAERLRATETLIVADYRGLTMTEIDDAAHEAARARRALLGRQEHADEARGRGRGLGRAARAARRADGDRVSRVDGDPVAVAKALDGRGRATRRCSRSRAACSRARPIEAAEVETLAKLPPLDVLRGQVLGAIAAR